MVPIVVKFQISPWTVETQVEISQKLSFFSIWYLFLGLYIELGSWFEGAEEEDGEDLLNPWDVNERMVWV